MGPILDEVIGPDMVRAFRSEPDAGPVIQPRPGPLCLFLWDFEPFLSPDPLNPLVVHMPARVVAQPGDHAIPVSPIATGKLNDVIGQALFI